MRVAEAGLAARVQPLEHERVLARPAMPPAARRARIDWPEMRMCRPVRLPSASKRADQLALRDRVVAAVQHVLLARPEQLDRRAGHLLGDRTAWRDIVLECAAPAEAAAEMDLVDLALVGRQAGGRQRRRERGLAVLRRHPDLAALRRVERRRVHRLHRRVVLERIGVDRLDLLRRAGDARPWRRRSGCRRRPPRRRGLPSASRRSSRSRPWRSAPSSQSIGSASSAVLARHQVSATTATAVSPTCTHLASRPACPSTLAASKLFTLPPKTGQSLIAAFSMPGSFEVDAVDLLAGQLVERCRAA